MVGATVGATPAELSARLGGDRVHFVAVSEGEHQDDPSDLLGFGPEEHFLLERLRQLDDVGTARERAAG